MSHQIRIALTAPSGAADGNFLDSYNCGMGPAVSQLCADDQTFSMIHRYVASIFIDTKTLGEKAPVQFVNGATNFAGLDTRVTTMLDPTGLQLADPVAHRAQAQTVILDYSGGKFPLTTKWLQGFFGGTVVVATPSSPAPARGQQTYGVVVVLPRGARRLWLDARGHDRAHPLAATGAAGVARDDNTIRPRRAGARGGAPNGREKPGCRRVHRRSWHR